MQTRDIQEMRHEDKQYGEKVKGKKTPYAKPKNQPNLARFNARDLLAMEDDNELDTYH